MCARASDDEVGTAADDTGNTRNSSGLGPNKSQSIDTGAGEEEGNGDEREGEEEGMDGRAVSEGRVVNGCGRSSWCTSDREVVVMVMTVDSARLGWS
jgi:hypothetical protein